MKKSCLIKQLKQDYPYWRDEDLRRAVEEFFASIMRAVGEKKSVQIRTFGTFLNKKKGSVVLNSIVHSVPRVVPERGVPVFRVSRGMKKVLE